MTEDTYRLIAGNWALWKLLKYSSVVLLNRLQSQEHNDTNKSLTGTLNNKNRNVYNRHTTINQFVETDKALRVAEQSDTQTTSRMNVPIHYGNFLKSRYGNDQSLHCHLRK